MAHYKRLIELKADAFWQITYIEKELAKTKSNSKKSMALKGELVLLKRVYSYIEKLNNTEFVPQEKSE